MVQDRSRGNSNDEPQSESPDERFLFSFVIPVFNVEDYLDDALESLVDQSLSFEDYVQVVLVNDGSDDSSGAICDRWHEAYPQNIVVLHKENEGVSAARNDGAKLAQGRYINFFDGDDRWSSDWCAAAKLFFEENPEIVLVAAKHTFFGAKEGPHPLSYKFKENKVIDLDKEPAFFLHSVSNAFIRADYVGRFAPGIEISEDFRMVNEILLETRKFGVLSGPTYWYRRREGGGSAITSSTENPGYYFETPNRVYRYLFELSRNENGQVPAFIQHAVMYDLQWRFKVEQKAKAFLSQDEYGKYGGLLCSLLRDIDDSVLLSQKNLFREEKLILLALKYGVSYESSCAHLHLNRKGDLVFYHSIGDETQHIKFCAASLDRTVFIESINLHSGFICIEGRFNTFFPIERVAFGARSGGRYIDAEVFVREDRSVTWFKEPATYTSYGFLLKLPARKAHYSFELVIDNRKGAATLKPGQFSPLGFTHRSWCQLGSWLLTSPRGKYFDVNPYSTSLAVKREILFQRDVLELSGRKAIRPLLYRAEALIYRAVHRNRELWLLSDRPTRANDNGEALFDYLRANPKRRRDVKFILRKDSSDYRRLKEKGAVIPFGSRAMRRAMLHASVIVSSQAEHYVFQAFPGDRTLFRDLYQVPFVFLQHGITKDDLSGWLAKWNKNISMLVTASEREQSSFVQNPKYGYGEDVVKLTGFPRHDRLLMRSNGAERTLIMAPTWRNDLTMPIDQKTGLRPRFPGFEDSEFFRFYSELMRAPSITSYAKEHGWKLRFLLHPAFDQERESFLGTDFEVPETFDYGEELADGSVWVTDYSSVMFDFVLRKKPVVYTHFDREEFFAQHTYDRGYFSYEDDGFGPVVQTVDEAAEKIVQYMESRAMEDAYSNRVDAFFYTPDAPLDSFPRCARVVEEVDRLIRSQKLL